MLTLNPKQLRRARDGAAAKLAVAQLALTNAEKRLAISKSASAREEYDEANRQVIAATTVKRLIEIDARS